jgi:hypothetical protein
MHPRVAVVLVALAAAIACKPPAASRVQDAGAGGEREAQIAVGHALDARLTLFLKVLGGQEPRLHDFYFSQTLPPLLPGVRFSRDVERAHEEQVQMDRYTTTRTVTDTYRGLAVGDKIIVFQRFTLPGGVAERGPWWRPVKTYPLSILGETTLEAKIGHGLDTEIYDRVAIGKAVSALDGIDFAASFIPGYWGAQQYFYEGNDVGLLAMAADAFTLGTASKVRSVAAISSGMVLGISAVRLSVDGYRAATGQANGATLVDALMASMQSGMAVFALIKVRIPAGAGAVQDVDDLIRLTAEQGRLRVSTPESAEYVAKRLGRTADDVLANGVEANELAKLTGRPLLPPSGVGQLGQTVRGIARFLRKGERVASPEGRLVLGIEETGHFYVVADGIRLDGQPLLRTRVGPGGLTNDGLQITFDAATPDQVARVRELMLARQGRFSVFGCVDQACSTLADAGIQLAEGGGVFAGRAPDATLEAILARGFVDATGQAVPFTVVRLGGGALEPLVASAQATTAFATIWFAAAPSYVLAFAAMASDLVAEAQRGAAPPPIRPQPQPPTASPPQAATPWEAVGEPMEGGAFGGEPSPSE